MQQRAAVSIGKTLFFGSHTLNFLCGGMAALRQKKAGAHRSRLVARQRKIWLRQTANRAQSCSAGCGAHIYAAATLIAKDIEQALRVIAGWVWFEAADNLSELLSAVISEMSTNERKTSGPLVVKGQRTPAHEA